MKKIPNLQVSDPDTQVAIDTIVEYINSMPKAKRLEFGRNMRFIENSDSVFIDSLAQVEAENLVDINHPFRLYFALNEYGDTELRINCGTMNNRPINDGDPFVYKFKKDDEEMEGWVQFKADLSGPNCTKFEAIYVEGEDPPDTTIVPTKNAIPDEVTGLIGYIKRGIIVHQILFKNMTVTNALIAQDYNGTDSYDNFYIAVPQEH